MAAGISGLLTAAGLALTLDAQSPAARPPSTGPALFSFVDEYCLSCHDEDKKKGGPGARYGRVARRWRAIPTSGRRWSASCGRARCRRSARPRPDDATYDAVVASLETSLDRAAAAHPNPGRTDTFRRLNRTEYQNAIRDLLALDVDVAVAAARTTSPATASTT